MEKLKNNKILLIAIAIIILVGVIMVLTQGFNFDLKYQKTQKIELNLEQEFEISDIKQITDEVFQKEQVVIQKVEVYEDTVSITAKEITDEQKSNLITKINEKYGKEFSAEEVVIKETPHTTGKDIIKPYIVPFFLATVIILLYISIRYRKLNSKKCVLATVGMIILSQIVLFSIIAITRIPVGSLSIPMVIVVYLLTLFAITNNLEDRLVSINKRGK